MTGSTAIRPSRTMDHAPGSASHAVYVLVLNRVVQARAMAGEVVTERAAAKVAELQSACGVSVTRPPGDLGFLVHEGGVRVAVPGAVRRAQVIVAAEFGAQDLVDVLCRLCCNQTVAELETLDPSPYLAARE